MKLIFSHELLQNIKPNTVELISKEALEVIATTQGQVSAKR